MENPTPKKATTNIVLGLLFISMAFGFSAMVMLFIAGLLVIGGPEWGPTVAIFGSPVLGVVMGMGSLIIMGVHAFFFFRKRQQRTPVYLGIWAVGWMVAWLLLTAPFIYEAILDVNENDGLYYTAENSLLWSVPLALLIGLLIGAAGNAMAIRR